MKDLRKKLLGKKGEDLAVEFLIRKGYKIIERNFSKRYGEIDIVAKDGDTLVFIEVKTRTSNTFGSPLEAVTHWKIKSLVKTANFYKLRHPQLPDDMRIDVVAIDYSNNVERPKVELIKSITS